MKFEKGNKGGGRPEGAKNKRTEQWEIFATYCMNGGLEKFQQEMDKLEGKDYVNAFLNQLEFHKPKLGRTEVRHEVADETIKQFIIKGAKGNTGK